MHTTKPPGPTPVDLLERAKDGDLQARDRLLGWAYTTARTYYLRKTDVEAALTVADAEDLASSFYMEFARAWPRIRAVYHYTRRMLKNNLRRHLVRARSRRGREMLLSQAEMIRRFESVPAQVTKPDRDWSDADWLKYRVIGRVIRTSDARTRKLIKYRCADPALPYREISVRTGTSEAALRMRMARFYEAVRQAHTLAAHRNQTTTHKDGRVGNRHADRPANR